MFSTSASQADSHLTARAVHTPFINPLVIVKSPADGKANCANANANDANTVNK